MIDMPLFIIFWGRTAEFHNGFEGEWEVEILMSGCRE